LAQAGLMALLTVSIISDWSGVTLLAAPFLGIVLGTILGAVVASAFIFLRSPKGR
jgi:hypothetical protein